jgi:hypothetical protein
MTDCLKKVDNYCEKNIQWQSKYLHRRRLEEKLPLLAAELQKHLLKYSSVYVVYSAGNV